MMELHIDRALQTLIIGWLGQSIDDKEFTVAICISKSGWLMV